MSDHGVVFLTGKALIEWLQVPQNFSALPPFVQRQILLGRNISRAMTVDQMVEKAAPSACLDRDTSWTESYAENMKQLEAEVVATTRD
ncbi:MAG: hypothetical protein U0S12_14845 [Fimbriimonadales bacterium]